MDIDYSPRRSGKTTRLIGWVLQDPFHRTIMVHNSQEANRLKTLIRAVYPDAPDGCVVTPAINLHGHKRVLAIDNADLLLSYLFGASVELITLTKVEE